MANSKEKLFEQFPPVSTEAWIEKVTADLKGADFDKKLVWKTNEGFNVKPMYRAEDTEGMSSTNSVPGEFPFVRGTKCDNVWLIRQDIKVDDVVAANAKAKDILTKGVTSLGFIMEADSINNNGIATLLDGINIEETEINFRCCIRQAENMMDVFKTYVDSIGADKEKVKGSLNYNPFKKMLKKGKDVEGFADMFGLQQHSRSPFRNVL